MDKLLIEGEGLNKYQALKQKKIRAAKEYAEQKGILNQLPKEKEFWENLVELVDQLCRIMNNANEVPPSEYVNFDTALKEFKEIYSKEKINE